MGIVAKHSKMVRASGKKDKHKPAKTGRAPKSIDEIYDEIHNPKFEEVRTRTRDKPLNEDLPGLGQYYCMSCARHFINVAALDTHNKTKAHKRRVKELKTKPYGTDLEEVYGMKIDNGPKLRNNERNEREQREEFERQQKSAK